MPEGSSPLLQVEGLCKRFGDFTALADVSLSVAEGEFICFLGPSGCGKTTLLRCVAGLEQHSAGNILQRGHDISRLPPAARDFGIVFQSYALFPNLTVAQNIAYGITARKRRPEVQSRIEELVTLVGLEGHERKYPSQLSGGEQQRVALARALAPGPSLLLLDEPLSALDAKVRARLRREVKALQRRLAVTTIMVTHDQEEALTMGDRIVVLNEGRIAQIGTPQEIYAHPANAFVADFIGAMNFIRARVEGANLVRLSADIELKVDEAAGILHPGTEIDICCRPEDVLIDGHEGSESNVFEATLTGLEYLGPFTRAELAPAGANGTRILADLPNEKVARLNLCQGQRLTVRLPCTRLHVFAPG